MYVIHVYVYTWTWQAIRVPQCETRTHLNIKTRTHAHMPTYSVFLARTPARARACCLFLSLTHTRALTFMLITGYLRCIVSLSFSHFLIFIFSYFLIFSFSHSVIFEAHTVLHVNEISFTHSYTIYIQTQKRTQAKTQT